MHTTDSYGLCEVFFVFFSYFILLAVQRPPIAHQLLSAEAYLWCLRSTHKSLVHHRYFTGTSQMIKQIINHSCYTDLHKIICKALALVFLISRTEMLTRRDVMCSLFYVHCKALYSSFRLIDSAKATLS